jgi:hypothetical protein
MSTYTKQIEEIEQKLNAFYERKNAKQQLLKDTQIQRKDLLVKSTILAKKIKLVTKKYDSCAKRLQSYLDVTLANALVKNKLTSKQLEEIREKAFNSLLLHQEIENLRLLAIKYKKLSKKAKLYSKTLINLELEIISIQSK